MLNNIEKTRSESYENLPRIEISFQDDFSGSDRELYWTPKYVARMLRNQNIEPTIGQKILLWEKDTNVENIEYYLCNIGEIVEADANLLQKYESYGHTISHKDLVCLGDKPILIEIDDASFFELPLETW